MLFRSIEVKTIPLSVVAGRINIWPAIPIDIADGDAETEVQRVIDDPRLESDVREMNMPRGVPVLAEQAVAEMKIGRSTRLAGIQVRIVRMIGMVEEEHIQIAILIIIEKDGLRGLGSGGVQSIFLCHLLVDGNTVADTLTDEKFVAQFRRIIIFPAMTHIDVHQSVTVDIGYTYPGGPGPIAGDVGLVGDVLEGEIAFIQEQLVVACITGKENVVQSVAVKVSNAYARAVVQVFIAEDVQRVILFDLIEVMDTGLPVIHQRE